MSISELVKEPTSDQISADEICEFVRDGVLGLLPDRVYEVEGRLVAAFRPEAQAIRVAAKAAGLSVEMIVPVDAELAMRTQYMAAWVLPILVGAEAGIPCQILATLIAARIEGWRNRSEALPEVVFRELIVEDGKVQEREVRGPAEEIEKLFRNRTESENQ